MNYRLDYVLFFMGLVLGLIGCAEIHFGATGAQPPVSGVLGYVLLASGTAAFVIGLWRLAQLGSEEQGDATAQLVLEPGPTLVTAAIVRLGAHLRKSEALGTRLALVAGGTFLNGLWISWLIDGVQRLNVPAKDNPRAFLWGACMQLGITCFAWAAIRRGHPGGADVASTGAEEEARQENRSWHQAAPVSSSQPVPKKTGGILEGKLSTWGFRVYFTVVVVGMLYGAWGMAANTGIPAWLNKLQAGMSPDRSYSPALTLALLLIPVSAVAFPAGFLFDYLTDQGIFAPKAQAQAEQADE